MKKSYFNCKAIAVCAAALLLAACSNKEETTLTDGIKAPVIYATNEMDPQSRSSLSVDGDGVGTIYWNPGDEINIFYGTTSTHYTSTNIENVTTAVFSTTDIIGSTESASENSWGLYPYDEDAICSGTSVSTTLPATQYAVAGSFDDDLYITLAHSNNTNLRFYNVCGGIKFSLSRNDITSITFSGNNNEDIAGDISLDFVDDLPNVSIISGAKTITVTPKVGSAFENGEYYYIILRPVMLSEGFTMTFTTTSGDSASFVYSKGPVTIKRSVFGKKENMDSFVVLPPPSNQIWYTSSDGNIVTPAKETGYSASIVSNTYSNGKGIIEFDGALTSMPNDAFKLKRSLTSIILPTGVRLSQSVFTGCSALVSASLPSDLPYISYRAFCACSALESIDLPQSITYINTTAFAECTSLSSITIPSNVSSINSRAFYNCTGLTSITVLPTTPPTLEAEVFDNTNEAPIYVPAGSVDAYKAAAYWSNYASRIQAIVE